MRGFYSLLLIFAPLLSFGRIDSLNIGISKIEIAGVDQPIADKYVSEYNRSNFEIHISTSAEVDSSFTFYWRVGYLNFNKYTFSEWDTVQNSLEFKIPEVGTGESIIEIKSQNANNMLSIPVKIERPWWRTWWFWGASFVSLFTLFYSREQLLKQWEDDEKKLFEKVVELELRTLQLQMNPHFIFNALNSIQSYVINQDTLKANNYLSKFAHLIRMFLNSSRTRFISIEEEIQLLTLYCEIERLRFENKFDFSISCDHKVDEEYEIPTMLLQPFVENAINHGLRYKEEKGRLEIIFEKIENFIICTITDDGVGRERAQKLKEKSNKGYKSQGISITEDRIFTYNSLINSEISFEISELDKEQTDPGTVVRIKFPLS